MDISIHRDRELHVSCKWKSCGVLYRYFLTTAVLGQPLYCFSSWTVNIYIYIYTIIYIYYILYIILYYIHIHILLYSYTHIFMYLHFSKLDIVYATIYGVFSAPKERFRTVPSHLFDMFENGSERFLVAEKVRTVQNGSERFLNYLVPTVQAGKNGSERFLRWLVWCFASRTVCSCEISFVILLMKAKGWTEFSRPTKSVWILCWSCIFTQANYSTSHRRLLVIFAT